MCQEQWLSLLTQKMREAVGKHGDGDIYLRRLLDDIVAWVLVNSPLVYNYWGLWLWNPFPRILCQLSPSSLGMWQNKGEKNQSNSFSYSDPRCHQIALSWFCLSADRLSFWFMMISSPPSVIQTWGGGMFYLLPLCLNTYHVLAVSSCQSDSIPHLSPSPALSSFLGLPFLFKQSFWTA